MGRAGGLEPGAGENVEAGGQGVAHRADEVGGPGNEGEETRVVGVHDVAHDRLADGLQHRLRVGALLGRGLAEQPVERGAAGAIGDRIVGQVGEVGDDLVGHGVAEHAHSLRGELQVAGRAVHGTGAGRYIQPTRSGPQSVAKTVSSSTFSSRSSLRSRWAGSSQRLVNSPGSLTRS